MTPLEGSKKVEEKTVDFNLQDKRQKRKPKYELGDIVSTANIKRVFSKRDTTNWSYKLYTITEIVDDSIPGYRIDSLPERYDQTLLQISKLFLQENKLVMEKLILYKQIILFQIVLF